MAIEAWGGTSEYEILLKSQLTNLQHELFYAVVMVLPQQATQLEHKVMTLFLQKFK